MTEICSRYSRGPKSQYSGFYLWKVIKSFTEEMTKGDLAKNVWHFRSIVKHRFSIHSVTDTKEFVISGSNNRRSWRCGIGLVNLCEMFLIEVCGLYILYRTIHGYYQTFLVLRWLIYKNKIKQWSQLILQKFSGPVSTKFAHPRVMPSLFKIYLVKFE